MCLSVCELISACYMHMYMGVVAEACMVSLDCSKHQKVSFY